MPRSFRHATAALLLLWAACPPAGAQTTNRAARPPRVYGGQVQMHEVPLGSSLPDPDKPHDAPEMPGGRDVEPIRAQPLPSTLPVQPGIRDYRADGRQPGDEDESGWGWLADDVIKARARKTEAGRELDDNGRAAENARAMEEGGPERDAAGSTNRQGDARGGREQAPGGSGQADTVREPLVRWNDAADRWMSDATARPGQEPPDMGMSVTGDVSSWDVMKPAEIPRDPMRGPVEFEAASARSDAVQGAERAGALPAATDPGPLGDFRPSWSPERTSLFNPLPTLGSADPGLSSGLGGSDLGLIGSPLGLAPVQPTPDPVASPSPGALSLSPSSAGTTPSLGGMGTENEHARPKTLPW